MVTPVVHRVLRVTVTMVTPVVRCVLGVTVTVVTTVVCCVLGVTVTMVTPVPMVTPVICCVLGVSVHETRCVMEARASGLQRGVLDRSVEDGQTDSSQLKVGSSDGLVVLETERFLFNQRARCSSVVRAFAHGAMGRRIDPSWGGPIELFLVPASAPRLV